MLHFFKYLYGINADRQQRQRNTKHRNLNETELGKNIFDTSSEDESSETELNSPTKNAATNTHEESSSQIDIKHLTPRINITYKRQISSPEEDFENLEISDSWRRSQNISSETDEHENQPEVIKDREEEDLPPQESNTEIHEISHHLENLCLDKHKLRLDHNIFEVNKTIRRHSTTPRRRDIQDLKRTLSDSNLRALEIRNQKTLKTRQTTLFDDLEEINTPGTSKKLRLDPEIKLFIRKDLYLENPGTFYKNVSIRSTENLSSIPLNVSKDLRFKATPIRNYRD